MSIAGGFDNAFSAAAAAGCDCLQIFVKNQRQWSAPELTDAAIQRYTDAQADTGISPVVAHSTYLINLASTDETTRRRSIDALVDECQRCNSLGVPYLVLHPGAHLGQGIDAGIDLVTAGLNEVHDLVADTTTQILLETTAGQGSSIGHEVWHLGRILSSVDTPQRLGVCLDTCHVFAAGYDLSDSQSYERFVGEIVEHVTLERVRCIHTNDSKGVCGSRLDRHEHIGKGRIGKQGFRNLLNDPRLAHAPRILETPKGTDGRGTDLDRVNLKRLRSLVD